MSCKQITYFLLASVFVVALGRWAEPEPEGRSQYCHMWKVWHQEGAKGVPVDKRNGWPDQAGRYFEECESENVAY